MEIQCNTWSDNSGDANTGFRNSGHYNTGDYNSGNFNSGDYNSGHYNSGFFCVDTPKPMFFDKPTVMSWAEAYSVIPTLDIPACVSWVSSKDMSKQEKKSHPTHKINGGYLKVLEVDFKEQFKSAWANMTDAKKAKWKSLPNFDADKFFTITGVDVRESDVTKLTVTETEKLLGKRIKIVK